MKQTLERDRATFAFFVIVLCKDLKLKNLISVYDNMHAVNQLDSSPEGGVKELKSKILHGKK